MLRPTLHNAAHLSVMLMLATQICLISAFWGVEQHPDYGTYIDLARQCVAEGSWYPSATNLHDGFIFAPGLVNLLAAFLRLFGSVWPAMYLNLALNLGIVYLATRLARHYFSERTADIFVILYALLYSTWWIAVPLATEQPFLFLALAGFCLMHKRGLGWALAAGIALALANWVRPLMLLFLVPGLAVMWQQRASWRHYAMLAAGLAATVCLIGFTAKQRTGHFVASSTTAGINLAIAYNEQSLGFVPMLPLADTTNSVLYISDGERLTYAEKDSIWRTRAMRYATAHPLKCVAMAAAKLPGQFIGDAWPDGAVLSTVGLPTMLKDPARSPTDKAIYLIIYVAKSTAFYCVCLLCLIGLCRLRRELLTRKATVLLIPLLGICLNCLLVASPRYHYPFLFALVLWAAHYLDSAALGKRAKTPR